jgi:hypothetical protein
MELVDGRACRRRRDSCIQCWVVLGHASIAGGARRWRLPVAVDGDGSRHTEDGWIGERRSALVAAVDRDGSTHARGWSGLGIFLGARVFSQASGAHVF